MMTTTIYTAAKLPTLASTEMAMTTNKSNINNNNKNNKKNTTQQQQQQQMNLRTKSIESCSSPSNTSQDSLVQSQLSSSQLLDHNCLVVDLSTPFNNNSNITNLTSGLGSMTSGKFSSLFTIESLLSKDPSSVQKVLLNEQSINERTTSQQQQQQQANSKLIRCLLARTTTHITSDITDNNQYTENNNNNNQQSKSATKDEEHNKRSYSTMVSSSDTTIETCKSRDELSLSSGQVNKRRKVALAKNRLDSTCRQDDLISVASIKNDTNKTKPDQKININQQKQNNKNTSQKSSRRSEEYFNETQIDMNNNSNGQQTLLLNIVNSDDDNDGENSTANLNITSKQMAQKAQSDEAIFQEWVVRVYGNSSKTKTITRDKYNKIVNYLSGNDNGNSSSKASFMGAYTPEQQTTLSRLCQTNKMLKSQQKNLCPLHSVVNVKQEYSGLENEKKETHQCTCNNTNSSITNAMNATTTTTTTTSTANEQTDRWNREELRFKSWVKSKGFVMVRESKIIQDSMNSMLARRRAQKLQSKHQNNHITRPHSSGKSSPDNADMQVSDEDTDQLMALYQVKSSDRRLGGNHNDNEDPLVLCVPSCSVGGNGRPVRDDRHYGNSIGAMLDQQRRAWCSPTKNARFEQTLPLDSKVHQLIKNEECGRYSPSSSYTDDNFTTRQHHDDTNHDEDGLNLTNRPQLKQVALVEDFFRIISDIHDQIIGRIRFGKHMGQKRTFQAITDRYAFLPREAVTKFLMSCRHCSRRMRTKNRFNADPEVCLRKSSLPSSNSVTTVIQSRDTALTKRQQQQQNRRTKQNINKLSCKDDIISPTTTPVSSIGSNSPNTFSSDKCHQIDGSATMIDRSFQYSKALSISPPFQQQQHHDSLYDDSSPASDSYNRPVTKWYSSKDDSKLLEMHSDKLGNLNAFEELKETYLAGCINKNLTSADRQQYSYMKKQPLASWYGKQNKILSESSNSPADLNNEPVLDLSRVAQQREVLEDQAISDATKMLILQKRIQASQQPDSKPFETKNDCRQPRNQPNISGVGSFESSPYHDWMHNTICFNHLDWCRHLYGQAVALNTFSPTNQSDYTLFTTNGSDLRSCQVMDLTNKQPRGDKHSLVGNIYPSTLRHSCL